MNPIIHNLPSSKNTHCVIYENFDLQVLTERQLIEYNAKLGFYDLKYQHLCPAYIEINTAVFISQNSLIKFPEVSLFQDIDGLQLSCTCQAGNNMLCIHQASVLLALITNNDYSLFFDFTLRQVKLKQIALDYGLQNEADLDSFFRLEYLDRRLSIIIRQASILAVTSESLNSLKKQLGRKIEVIKSSPEGPTIIVLRQHKYYKHLVIELFQVAITRNGKIKNPMVEVTALDYIWDEQDTQIVKFYTAINKFQSPVKGINPEIELAALRAVIKNPLGFSFYYHDAAKSENISANSVVSIEISLAPVKLDLRIGQKDQFFELGAVVEIENICYELKDISILFSWFLLAGGKFYLIPKTELNSLTDLFKKRAENLLVHKSVYKKFKAEVLLPLEDNFKINYNYIQAATGQQLLDYGFANALEKIIYLSDFGEFVMIIPVCRYGEIEIPVRTKRQIFEQDINGKDFYVKRDTDAELNFTSLIISKHNFFTEQLKNGLEYFYLHKKRFLDENWFLTVFDEWARQEITILGFNDLEGNRLNSTKVSISVTVLSGINWFNALVRVRFGKRKAALKQVQKAIKNKSKYVQLDDGTLGILPDEWIERFTLWFRSSEIVNDEMLKIPKVNFSGIDVLFRQDEIDSTVQQEIHQYQKFLVQGQPMKEIIIPAEFKGTLRNYQHDGLNWLNFLDDNNFGGCLADDMGLGKTIQIIAFILLQREKVITNTNLLIVPTSLIQNWQSEINKFAPSATLKTIYGSSRVKNCLDFNNYEIILTSYGTLITDITFLKEYTFNYIFLDESQNIKNAESQRNRAVKLLKARNRIAITGTPIENFTTDIYGQLSFTCPGLLGTRQTFKDLYSIPIDRFKSNKKLAELKEKVRPFILHRSKQDVAPELPEKTEMVLYCEMGEEQKNIYDAAEKELRDYISATTNEEIRKTPMSVLRGLTRLRQICDSPRLLKNDALNGTGSAKIDTLLEQIEGKMGQHKILIFSQFVTMLDLIRSELIVRGHKHTYLTGASKNRGPIVDEFQTNPEIRIFLISLKAGGTGLNLTEADYVYLVDPWWNPAVENQAIDRSHRIGQNKNIVAVRLICPGTVEEKILNLQSSKQMLADNLIQNQYSLLKSLEKNELMKILN